MKTIQTVSALLAASATLSMAGVLNVYTEDAKKASTSLNLTTIDSLIFSGKAEKKVMEFSGKAKQNAIKLSDMDHIDFTLKDKSKEKMTVVVGDGIFAGKHTFKLSEIKNIEIVEVDSDEDKDGDGLTDLSEIYKYDTNPNSADTDGDGWSDGEELADGMYSPTNPTKFNPRIADVPGLRVTLKKSPRINLNVTVSEGVTESKSVTEGKEVSKTNSMSYEQTRSADLMNSWELSTTQGWEIGKNSTGWEGKYTGSVTVGYNGSYTTSTGMTWSSTEEKSVAESYEKAVAEEKSMNREVNGATLCMQVELKNTSDIAFTIEALKLSASTYDIKDTSSLKILAELTREGDWSDVTLKPNESVDANFCNDNVKVELIENMIYNTSSIVLGASSQKITFDGGSSDFTVAYTKVAAKTADITIDYGPGSAGNPSARYQVATNYRYNVDHKGTDDMYSQTTLAELLRNAHVDFKQDSIEGPSKKKLYGLAAIEGYEFNLADSAMWYVTIQRAANLKKGINTMDLYSFACASYDMEKIFIGAGDAVHIFYSKDQDHDGVPLPTEHLFGTDDTKVDTDGDGISDYDEISGWTKGESTVKIYTSPVEADTDGDGMNDKEDPEPTKRPLFTDASLSLLQVFPSLEVISSSPADSLAELNLDSAALAKKDSFGVSIQAPIAFIKVVPNEKKVTYVKFITDSNEQCVQGNEVNGKNVYTFNSPTLTLLKPTNIKIEVKSEAGDSVKIYKLSISSSLIPPDSLKLGKDTSRANIYVNYIPSTDSRVKGYFILREKIVPYLTEWEEDSLKVAQAELDYTRAFYKSECQRSLASIYCQLEKELPKTVYPAKKERKELPDSLPNMMTTSILSGAYDDFDYFKSNDNSYKDEVGAGSPYYSYRVYAYSEEGNYMVFSKGTKKRTRSVGRIKITYSMDDFGAEYYRYVGYGRAHIVADVSLHEGDSEGSKTLTRWHGFDYEAGDGDSGETVIFFSEKKTDDDIKPSNSVYERTIGGDGLYLYFNVLSKSDPGNDYKRHSEAKAEIRWPYSEMVDVLKKNETGSGKDGEAPRRGQFKYLIGAGENGKKGIDYSNKAPNVKNSNVCSDDCGDEPHTGYKFTFKYEWVDDEWVVDKDDNDKK